MTATAKDVLDRIRATVTNSTSGLSPSDYRDVWEELHADATAHLAALDDGDDDEVEDD